MKYTYEIIAVDPDSRVMEVVYTHETHGKIHISARLPFEGELLEDIIKIFAPTGYWRDLETPVVIPQSGVSGVIDESTSQTEDLSLQVNEVQL